MKDLDLKLPPLLRGAPVPLALGALLVAGSVLLVPLFLDLVRGCGHDIPQPELSADYLKALVWAGMLGLGILFWPVCTRDKQLLLAGWCAKVAVALGVMLAYENQYGLDAYMYFDESRGEFQFSAYSFTDGTANLINLARMHNLLIPDSYHAMKVSFAMLGLVGIYFFYRAGVLFLGREERRIFYLLCLFPGILFWSSILGKDPLVFLGIALYSFGVVGWTRRRQTRYLVAIACGVAAAVFIRQWLGIIMLVPLGLLVFRGVRGVAAKAVFTVFVAAALAVSAGPFLQRFKIEAITDLLTVADSTTKGFVSTAGGSTQELDVDLTNPRAVLAFLPKAAFTALFRPLPGEILNPFGLLAGLESALLLVLLLLSLKRSRLRDLKEPLVQWCLLFLVIWALLNGIVSSANFGVGVRYKLQVLPLLLGLLMYLARRRNPAALRPGAPPAAASAATHALGGSPGAAPKASP